jgi:hypothetical protein
MHCYYYAVDGDEYNFTAHIYTTTVISLLCLKITIIIFVML